MTFIATAALLLTAVTLLPVGGVLFAPFLLGLFLLALLGVFTRHTDGTVRRQSPPLGQQSWRDRE
jgi:hypothetical protein